MSVRHIDWETHTGDERAYLGVDAFISDMVGARALSTAFETGVIDYLLKQETADAASLSVILQLDERGTRLLLSLLRANRVIEPAGDEDGNRNALHLSPAFAAALRFRDILEAKLHFANLVAPDFIHLSTALLMEPQAFFEHARIFKLFSYQRAHEAKRESIEQTVRWMRITTALTTYEAQACMAAFDFSGYRRMLDVGGNSGEFALRVCGRHAELQATVYDLPLVCDIGARHVADCARDRAEAARIAFVRRDPAVPALPADHDLITFKSMLHDWPDDEMAGFLQRAYDALPSGGTLMIFERAQVDVFETRIGYGQVPLMLFFRSYRRPEDYGAALAAIGFHSIEATTVPLDMSFILMTARK